MTAIAGHWLAPLLARAPVPCQRMGGAAGRYVYLHTAGSRVVALESAGGLSLPIAITVTPALVDRARRARRILLGGGSLRLDGETIAVDARDDALPRIAPGARRAARAARRLRHGAPRAHADAGPGEGEPACLGHAVTALEQALESTGSAALRAAAKGLVGLGLGSTPSGDDVLCGALATLAALERGGGASAPWAKAVRGALASCCTARPPTTPLSAELLASAAAGHVLPRLAKAIAGALAEDLDADALAALHDVGHHSGHYLAVGAALVLAAAARPEHREKH